MRSALMPKATADNSTRGTAAASQTNLLQQMSLSLAVEAPIRRCRPRPLENVKGDELLAGN